MRKARMTAIPLATITLVATLPLSASAEGVWSQKGLGHPRRSDRRWIWHRPRDR